MRQSMKEQLLQHPLAKLLHVSKAEAEKLSTELSEELAAEHGDSIRQPYASQNRTIR